MVSFVLLTGVKSQGDNSTNDSTCSFSKRTGWEVLLAGPTCVICVGKCSRNTLHLSKLICTDEIDACVRI